MNTKYKLTYTVKKPLNREPKLHDLVSSFITQHEQAYDRNHGPIPHLCASNHRVGVYGLVQNELSLSIPDLTAFPQHTVICALQCAGNRRHTMRTKLKEVHGIDWFDGAVMNCAWTGPLLCDVLAAAGIKVDEKTDAHVAFSCFQTPCQDDEWYGASIPLSRALDPEASILLALKMNGEDLPPNHGAPVRVVTPGIAGARSVKWLDRITVQTQESNNYYQRHDYKILPPEASTKEEAEQWWDRCDALQDMPVNSVIGIPSPNASVQLDENEMVEVKGYALPSGGDGPIVRVEVSGDEGKTWTDAQILRDESVKEKYKGCVELKWAWALWRTKVKVEKGKGRKIWSRATDRSGNTQKAPMEVAWNFRGVAYNGYGEVDELEIV
ncbi:molybdopterin binding oxidoreductase [Massarina eburnea CBS 473.64]|uniref:Molybdopterin binding oxidoreductase n=1 Tax=Massarina eburnea CBS 473.64 TaxID=1395130 RepID=A0A6A6SFE6_9PLEO|nr:molybdopterin binding oxidoreductase [Massarina eburnea CBS 473.64]